MERMSQRVNLNDIGLTAELLKVEQLAGQINRLSRDGEINALWKTLGEIARHSDLALFALLRVSNEEANRELNNGNDRGRASRP